MRDYQIKQNIGGTPDTITNTRLGANEMNSALTELKTAVERTAQTLSPADGTAEILDQLSQAIFINATSAQTFQDNGSSNTYELTPATGVNGLVVPTDYNFMEGAQLSFLAGNENTGSSTLRIGQDTGSYLAIKKLLNKDGTELNAGDIKNEYYTVSYSITADSGSGAFILIGSSSIQNYVSTVSVLRNTTSGLYNGLQLWLMGYDTIGDGGSQPLYWKSASVETDNGGTIFKSTTISTGRFKTLVSENNITDAMFGVHADGTDETTRLQNAFDNSGNKLTLLSGSRGITSPITADRTGFKLFGVSEQSCLIIPLPGFTGTYLIDWGNASISRNRCEIRNVGFNPNSESNITAIRWRRINNTSKIVYCSFEQLNKAIEFDSLAIANTIGWNRFWANTTNIELINEAGNSTLIEGNYMDGGLIYLNNSMTNVRIVNNTMEGIAGIYSDGAAGPRGVEILSNRFESNAAHIAVDMGFSRGVKVAFNDFLGGSVASTAIEFRSSGVGGSADVSHNYFENFLTSYVISSIPNGGLSIIGNIHDSSAPTPYNTNITYVSVEGVTSEDGIFKVYTNTKRFGVEQKIIKFFVEKQLVTSGVAVDVFNVVTGSVEKGGFTCNIEGFANFSPNSTATAAMSIKGTFAHTNANDGTPADGLVEEVYQSASAATASGTRDITNITLTNVNVDDQTTKIQAAVTWTGTSTPKVVFEVKLIWDGYVTIPELNAL